MFNSVEATDEFELLNSKHIYIGYLEDEELKKYFVPSKFCLVLNTGEKFGPYGTDSLGRKPVTILIDNGDVLAQGTSSFLYLAGSKFEFVKMTTFKNDECFSFCVSNET